MKKKQFRELTEFEKCIRIERFIYQKFNSVSRLDMYTFSSIMKVIKQHGLMDTQITFKLSNEKNLCKDFTQKDITRIYETTNKKGKTNKKETITHISGCEVYGNIVENIFVADTFRYKMDDILYLNFCPNHMKKGWNFILKKIETDIMLYDTKGERIPPTKKECRYNIIGYYK